MVLMTGMVIAMVQYLPTRALRIVSVIFGSGVDYARSRDSGLC